MINSDHILVWPSSNPCIMMKNIINQTKYEIEYDILSYVDVHYVIFKNIKCNRGFKVNIPKFARKISRMSKIAVY